MMVGTTLATCGTCGFEVSVYDIRGVGQLSNREVLIGYRCPACQAFARRAVTVEEARLVAARSRGEPTPPSADERLLAAWELELDSDLTVQVFQNAWAYERRRYA